MIEFALEPISSLDALADTWRRLEVRATPSFFTSWHWIGSFLAAVPEADRPMLLRGGTEALALIGCRRHRRRVVIRSRAAHLNCTGEPRYDCVFIEHNGILAARGHEAEADAALIAFFRRQRPQLDELFLHGLAQPAAEARTLIVRPSYMVELDHLAPDGSAERVLSANARSQLRRTRRGFEQSGPLALERAASQAEALAFFGELKRLHVASWERRERTHAFDHPFFEIFHRLLIARAFPATELLRVAAGPRILGYLYNFRLGDRVYAYQSGFDDADHREQPGTICHLLAIEDAYRRGARVYDFMAGRNRLKERFSTSTQPMYWQVVQQKRIDFAVERMASAVKARLAPFEGAAAAPSRRAEGGPTKVKP